MSNVSRQVQRRSTWFVRSAAALGAFVSAFFLPVALLGVVVGPITFYDSRSHDWVTASIDLWILTSGFCGVLGFAGFTLFALLPMHVLTGHVWVKRTVATTLLCGVVAAVIVVVPSVPINGVVGLGQSEALLSGLALLGCMLVRYLTANPSIERTSSGKLRLPPAAAHVKR